jgi:hypothetical protein
MAPRKAGSVTVKFRASEVEAKYEPSLESIVTRVRLGALTVTDEEGKQAVRENKVLGDGQAIGVLETRIHDAKAAAIFAAGEDYLITITPAE